MMAEVTAIYRDTSDAMLASLEEMGIDAAAIRDVVEVPAPVFRLALQSRTNSHIFQKEIPQVAGQPEAVCAIRLSGEQDILDALTRGEGTEKMVCSGTDVSWDGMQEIANNSKRYMELVQNLERLENKCMSVDDRNSVRRQQFQQEYEYLQEEIDKLETVLKNIPLSRS